MMTYYIYDLYGRYEAKSEVQTLRSTNIAPETPDPAWNWNGVSWVWAPDVIINPVIQSVATLLEDKRVTRFAFRHRIADALPTIYGAARSDNLELAIAAQIVIDDLASAEYVDLADPKTITKIDNMVAAGLMEQSVRDYALNTPVEQNERP